jgi:uncharacterized protein (DUF2252 family)
MLAVTNPLPSRTDKYREGKLLRSRTPRELHGDLHGPLERDAVAILAESDKNRVRELLPERYRRMIVDPFAFLRGAAAVMATDLAHQPVAGVPVHSCGDCHLMNFGAFTTPENNILFDINDFDETLPGVDFTVDVKRLAASVAVAAKTSGLSGKRACGLAAGAVAAYREHMFGLMELSSLQIWHSRIDLEEEVARIEDPRLRVGLSALIDKVRSGGLETDDNFPHLVTGAEPKIADRPPTIFHFGPNADPKHRIDASRVFELYRASLAPDRLILLDRYRLTDLSFKAVGVGSVGTFCCVGLFMGGDGDHLFLQVKEAQNSVLERLAPGLAYRGPQGRRVVEGQRMMQAASGIFLGWTSDKASGRQFYIRILKNRRLGGVSEIAEQEALSYYARLCGRTLARAHARSGHPAAIAGYMGRSGAFDDAIASFALAYANQTVIDHGALVKAKKKPTSQRKAA